MDKKFNISKMEVKNVTFVAFYIITDANVCISEMPWSAAENSIAYRIGEAQSDSCAEILTHKKAEMSEEVIIKYNNIKYRIGYCPISIPPEYYSDQE